VRPAEIEERQNVQEAVRERRPGDRAKRSYDDRLSHVLRPGAGSRKLVLFLFGQMLSGVNQC